MSVFEITVQHRSGDTWPVVRVDVYYFYDADPTRDPESTLIRQVEVPFDIPADGEWHEIDVELPSHTFSPGPTGSPATRGNRSASSRPGRR